MWSWFHVTGPCAQEWWTHLPLTPQKRLLGARSDIHSALGTVATPPGPALEIASASWLGQGNSWRVLFDTCSIFPLGRTTRGLACGQPTEKFLSIQGLVLPGDKHSVSSGFRKAVPVGPAQCPGLILLFHLLPSPPLQVRHFHPLQIKLPLSCQPHFSSHLYLLLHQGSLANHPGANLQVTSICLIWGSLFPHSSLWKTGFPRSYPGQQQ